MDVAIAGGHGKIGLQLGRLLAGRGDRVRGLVRNPEQADDLVAGGIEPVLCDLEGEHDVAAAVRGADAVVFAAGVKLIDAARAENVHRYVMVSAMGAADPPAGGGDVFAEYLRAKADADRALEASGLEYTIVRPGGLTDDPPTGLVTIGSGLERGQVPRADVAAVLGAVLPAANAVGKAFELVSGKAPIEEAVAGLRALGR